jgi:hypothetical protein
MPGHDELRTNERNNDFQGSPGESQTNSPTRENEAGQRCRQLETTKTQQLTMQNNGKSQSRARSQWVDAPDKPPGGATIFEKENRMQPNAGT